MRLIDADALLKGKDDHQIISTHLIWNAPTVDAVAVVRCVQCSHSEVCKMDEGDVRYCHIFEMQMEDDYYCADGERKDDGND